jgi:hypothetical protein
MKITFKGVIMKFTTLLAASLFGLSLRAIPLPHMDLNMGGFEYESLLEMQLQNAEGPDRKHIFDDIFATGKRNLDWIRLLNQNRTEPISLSTPETQQGYPLDNPRTYNPEIIRQSYNQLRDSMPTNLRDVLFGVAPLPTQLPGSVEEYMKWGLEVDRVYQIAARWRTYEPYMDYLLQNSTKDIRGYYFITTTPNLQERLKDWGNFKEDEKATVTLWLNQVCRTSVGSIERCRSLTDQAIRRNQAHSFFQSHKSAGERILSEMMYIPANGRFSRVTWSSPHIARIPFVEPADGAMRSYLLSNIETEWQIQPFALRIDWVPENQYGVKVIWSPGVTPHVPGLGSNLIYMDANAPISEYDVQWTIRHEFGHVLGFPDCYVEFYDTDLKAIVGYQIDTTDLMCSRRGHLKERHVLELQRTYSPSL